MEIFIDGGLFELAIAIVFGYAANFIFMKKILLIIFSCIFILTPIALIAFTHLEELQVWLTIICILNALLLVAVLWTVKMKFPGQPLFDIDKLKRIVSKKKDSKTKAVE